MMHINILIVSSFSSMGKESFTFQIDFQEHSHEKVELNTIGAGYLNRKAELIPIDMTGIQVRCAYCGQNTKTSNCGFFRGMSIHNMPNCNCMQTAMKLEFSDFNKRKWFV